MLGRPFFLYERTNNFGPYGDLTLGLSMGDPRSQSLDAKSARIVASSHDGITVMFWNDYETGTRVQWEGNVGIRGGEPVYGPTGDALTLGDILDQMTWGMWIDSREELGEIHKEQDETFRRK